jgi:hypothetical protein
VLTIPVSTASAKRSFSKLKIIKNYLRNAMTQERLSAIADAKGGQMGHLTRVSRLLKGPLIFNYHLNTVRHIDILYQQIINLYYAYHQLFGK